MHDSTFNQISLAVKQGKKISFVSGNFNVVHPGHLRLLKFASEISDILVVCVLKDGNPGVYVPLPLRIDGLRALSIVMHILRCSFWAWNCQVPTKISSNHSTILNVI